MQLHCNSCQHLIPASDINIDLGIAKCSVCNNVVNILDDLGCPAAPRPAIPEPKRIRVENWGGELVIQRRWYQHSAWALLAFCIFWDGFLAVWYTVGIRELFQASQSSGPIWFMLLFPVLHVAVGLGLSYAVLCMFLNKTTICVSGGELTVRHGPVPSAGNCNLLTADIKQLFCTEKKFRGEESIHRTYSVVALKQDDSQVTLVSSLDNRDHAWFIEQQLESHLKIADQRVPGEVRLNSAA